MSPRPQTELGTSWGDEPTWEVPRGQEAALAEDPVTPFFTIHHFRGTNACRLLGEHLDDG